MTPDRRDVLRGIAAAGTAPAIAGVASAHDDDDYEDDNDYDEDALVRAVHASPDAPDVDVYVDGDRVLKDVEYGTISDYLRVEPDEYEVKITAAGDRDTVVFEDDLELEEDEAYTVVATGELAEDDFEVFVYEDDRSIRRDRARVRVIHASPDAPDVDVTLDEGDAVLIEDLEFGEASDYLTVKPGRYELEVRPASSKNDNPFDAEFDVRLRPGRVYTVVATGFFMPDKAAEYEVFDLLGAVDARRDDDH
ncbi:DUF4397 domain-containing protein [Haloarcula nitratireducens]|uniref:DUF4397 domain-containing protein n=1 Tax=Haloarcula nitratireducens TaxID=2487749 RepID=A0AAW4PGW1_9EURY|nr:DUF4397 domain-containing protein [Halomicroarcula nitratireducens]MBX0297166.1 DUF4397 domain-containing protein [Halomicroarcula nitratireducens]